jgi:hypothetical protein
VIGGGGGRLWTPGRAWLLASIAVMVPFAWLLTAGSWNVLQRQYYDDFYDAQARSLLDGHWDVDSLVVQTEGFVVGDEVHTYFGPTPALARMPLLVVTDRFDGRLTTLSMLAAMAVLAVAAFHLDRVIRTAIRGDRPAGRTEVVASGLLAAAALAGVPLWLGSQAVVHHEAQLWGVALGVAAFAALARWWLEPSGRRLVAVSALTAAAISTRQPIGGGALVAFGVLAGWALLARQRRSADGSVATRAAAAASRPWALLAAGALPVVASIVPNLARFGHPSRVPFDRQIANQFPEWVSFREANGGSYFRPEFVPTTLLQYLRPDAVDLRSHFPWVDYPLGGPTTVGGVAIGPSWVSSSLPVTMPALSLLALVGVVALARWLWRRRDPAWLGCLVLGAAVGSVPTLSLGSISHRYLGDLYPAVLILALLGFHAGAGRVGAAVAGRGTRRRRRARTWLVAGAAAALVAVGGLVNLALAFEYQRERAFLVTDAWRGEWLRVRSALPGADDPLRLAPHEPLPATASDGTAVIVGECDALYLRVDERWVPVERGEAAGIHEVRVDLDGLGRVPDGDRAPLLTVGDGADETTVAVSRSGGRTQVAVWAQATGRWVTLVERDLEGLVTFRVVGDPRLRGVAGIHHAGQPHEVPLPAAAVGPVRVGHAGTARDVRRRFPGPVDRLTPELSTCRALSD